MVINFNNFRDKNLKSKILEIMEVARKEIGRKNNISANITIVGRDKIRELNREFRNIDRITDVLSFPLLENDELTGEEMQDESIFTDLGDIVICKSRAMEQAKEYGHSIEREICFLALHGFLHINGYDHIQKEDEKVMFSLQEKILKKVNVNR